MTAVRILGSNPHIRISRHDEAGSRWGDPSEEVTEGKAGGALKMVGIELLEEEKKANKERTGGGGSPAKNFNPTSQNHIGELVS
jgi:hypothetical protein